MIVVAGLMFVGIVAAAWYWAWLEWRHDRDARLCAAAPEPAVAAPGTGAVEPARPAPGPAAATSQQASKPIGFWPAGLALALSAIGFWFAETYKPSVSNQLGLNGNTFVLKPGAYHAIVIVSIVLLAVGVVRLVMAASNRR